MHLLAESYTPSLQNFTADQHGAPLLDGARPIANFTFDNTIAVPVTPPSHLSSYPTLNQELASNLSSPRTVSIAMRRGSFYLNNRVFGGMQDVLEENLVKPGSSEVWEFANDSAMGMGMGMGGMMQNYRIEA